MLRPRTIGVVALFLLIFLIYSQYPVFAGCIIIFYLYRRFFKRKSRNNSQLSRTMRDISSSLHGIHNELKGVSALAGKEHPEKESENVDDEFLFLESLQNRRLRYPNTH